VNSIKVGFRAAGAVRRLPFTLISLAVLSLIAVATNTTVGEISRHLFRHLSFAPRDLLILRWGRVLTSALVTTGGEAFWEALVLMAVSLGAAEWLAGPWRTAATFWGVHVTTLVAEALLIAYPLRQLGDPLGTALLVSRDVGPSAGALGCLGLACARLPGRWRWVAGGVIMGGLLAALVRALILGQQALLLININLGHALAFPLGWLASGLGRGKDRQWK
jgi:hypothetical protein